MSKAWLGEESEDFSSQDIQLTTKKNFLIIAGLR